MDFSTGVEVKTGTVLMKVDERDLDIVNDVALPKLVAVEVRTAPEEPAQEIYGGLALNPCTSGFSVDEIDGFQQGVSTAGHCSNSVTYQGTTSPSRMVNRAGTPMPNGTRPLTTPIPTSSIPESMSATYFGFGVGRSRQLTILSARTARPRATHAAPSPARPGTLRTTA